MDTRACPTHLVQVLLPEQVAQPGGLDVAEVPEEVLWLGLSPDLLGGEPELLHPELACCCCVCTMLGVAVCVCVCVCVWCVCVSVVCRRKRLATHIQPSPHTSQQPRPPRLTHGGRGHHALTLHATRYTLHATRYTLHTTRYTLHATHSSTHAPLMSSFWRMRLNSAW
jgi:hypothetical protein